MKYEIIIEIPDDEIAELAAMNIDPEEMVAECLINGFGQTFFDENITSFEECEQLSA